MNWNWMLKMAWRDSRRHRGRLMLFMSSIVLGIAAMVAISSFGDLLQDELDEEAKTLLGADIEVESQRPLDDWVVQYFDSLNIEISREISFGSMVRFDETGATRLVNIRAIDGRFPFYGDFETNPPGISQSLNEQRRALASESLMLQFNVTPGDTIGIGTLDFELAGSVTRVPGQSGITGSVAPPVFMPYDLVEATGLLQKGSRINYKLYGKYPEGFNPERFEKEIKPRLQDAGLRSDDVAERKERTGAVFENLTGFLNLTAFVALLLGCIGVASSAHLYVKEKVKQVAILRCIGASGRESAGIYLIQLLGMAVPASILGALLGSVFQFLLPSLVADFLPVSVEAGVSFKSIMLGIVTGVLTAMVFALPPLLRITDISPLQVLRADLSSPTSKSREWLLAIFTVLYITIFAMLQLNKISVALIFVAGLLLAVALLALIAWLLMKGVRKYIPASGSFIFRQGLSNLFRPNNQTLVLIVTIGLGTGLITTLLLSQSVLLDKLQQSANRENSPNMVVFDVQDDQLDSLQALTQDYDFPVIGTVPIVNMRLHSVKGRLVSELKNDTTSGVKPRVLSREYRVTYRDSLTDAETVIAGEWIGYHNPQDGPVPISLSDGMAESMNVEPGDQLAFNVQGAIIECVVGNIREVDWQRVQTNFVLVFPAGVLEQAPKFHVMLTRFGTVKESADYQGQVVKTFPNVSIVDLNLVLDTIDEISGKASFVIRFMALISMFTGLIVLIASVRTSKFQRIQEAVLLRTLGASKKQLLRIALVEYIMLGSLAALTGIGIALVASMALAQFSFNALLSPEWIPVLITYLVIVGLTVLIGMLNSRSVVNEPPLSVLNEVR